MSDYLKPRPGDGRVEDEALREDLYDALVAALRRDDPRESLAEVKEKLGLTGGLLSATQAS